MLSKIFCPIILMSLVSFNLVAIKSCGSRSSDVDVDIISTIVSPNKEYVATIYYISGGGAAGYVYGLVNLRRQEDTFNPKKGIIFQVTHTQNITVMWKDDVHLMIKHSKPSSLLTQAKEWSAGAQKIYIHYTEE